MARAYTIGVYLIILAATKPGKTNYNFCKEFTWNDLDLVNNYNYAYSLPLALTEDKPGKVKYNLKPIT